MQDMLSLVAGEVFVSSLLLGFHWARDRAHPTVPGTSPSLVGAQRLPSAGIELGSPATKLVSQPLGHPLPCLAKCVCSLCL